MVKLRYFNYQTFNSLNIVLNGFFWNEIIINSWIESLVMLYGVSLTLRICRRCWIICFLVGLFLNRILFINNFPSTIITKWGAVLIKPNSKYNTFKVYCIRARIYEHTTNICVRSTTRHRTPHTQTHSNHAIIMLINYDNTMGTCMYGISILYLFSS